MRKVKLFFVAILGLLLIPCIVSAKGNISVSTSNLSITRGGSGSFKITASNAAGKVNVSSSNPSVASVSTSGMFLDMESTTVRVTGKSVGSAVIKVYVEDGTTYDDENISGRTYNINVNVKEPVVYSSNNTLKDISVDGYELTKIDNNNYELVVNNEVSTIKVNASAEDEKAKVTGSGVGEVPLQIGINNLEIVIVAENGSKNVINLKVTRKDGYYLEDLSTVINKDEDTTILLTDSSKITSEHLETVKKSKKKVSFNYVNENKVVMYSWIVDGNELDDIKEIDTKITFTSENVNDIGAVSNYADGKYINFQHSGELPKSTKVKLYVADKFSNGDVVNVYYYDKDSKSLTSIKEALEVKDGYIEFDIEHCSEYFVTRSTIMGAVSEKKSFNIFIVISIIELVIIVGLSLLFVIKMKGVKKDTDSVKIESPVVATGTEVPVAPEVSAPVSSVGQTPVEPASLQPVPSPVAEPVPASTVVQDSTINNTQNQ